MKLLCSHKDEQAPSSLLIVAFRVWKTKPKRHSLSDVLKTVVQYFKKNLIKNVFRL